MNNNSNLSPFDFSQKVREFVRNQKYKEALNYFKQNKGNFTREQIRDNPYLVQSIISALRKTNNSKHVMRFLQEYDISIDGNTNLMILNSYGWALYDLYKLESNVQNFLDEDNEDWENQKDYQFNEVDVISNGFELSDLQKEILRVFSLLSKITNDNYAENLRSNLLGIILKVEKKKQNPNWMLVNEVCNSIAVGLLSSNCPIRELEERGKKVKREFASDREKWYYYKTKALYELGKYQECIQIGERALQEIKKFHHDYDIWIKRCIALSNGFLGNRKEAISQLEKVYQVKKEWYILAEIAKLYLEEDNYPKAMSYAATGLQSPIGIEKKINLVFLMGVILEKSNEIELAYKHYLLAKLTRVENNWKIPAELGQSIARLQKELNNHASPNQKQLLLELRHYWQSLSLPSTEQERKEGKIVKILHANEKGVDGFIESKDGNSYYFRSSADNPLSASLKVGRRVSFEVENLADGKLRSKNIKLLDR